MKYKPTLIVSIFLCLFSLNAKSQEFDEEQMALIQSQLDSQLKIDYSNFGDASNEDKTIQFPNILDSIAHDVLLKQWVHPTNGAWPLVDWTRVDKLDSFFDNQSNVVETKGVVADSDDQAARFAYAHSLISASSASGESWFQVWLLNLAKENDSNLKRLTFLSADECGVDFNKTQSSESGEQFVVDWNAWKFSYDQSNKLGKAILLKCMTRLAIITDNWDKLKEIHLSVFNGNDDDLKAIALVKGSSSLGEAVIAKWTDLAENSTNAKLKNLAQQALTRHTGEAEDLE